RPGAAAEAGMRPVVVTARLRRRALLDLAWVINGRCRSRRMSVRAAVAGPHLAPVVLGRLVALVGVTIAAALAPGARRAARWPAPARLRGARAVPSAPAAAPRVDDRLPVVSA